MQDNSTMSPEAAFEYIGEVLSAYMKTLPQPIRKPVIQYVNYCTAILGNELRQTHKLREALDEINKELEIIKSGQGD